MDATDSNHPWQQQQQQPQPQPQQQDHQERPGFFTLLWGKISSSLVTLGSAAAPTPSAPTPTRTCSSQAQQAQEKEQEVATPPFPYVDTIATASKNESSETAAAEVSPTSHIVVATLTTPCDSQNDVVDENNKDPQEQAVQQADTDNSKQAENKNAAGDDDEEKKTAVKGKVTWTADEDNALWNAVAQDQQNRKTRRMDDDDDDVDNDHDENHNDSGEEDWETISLAIPRKTVVQCLKRYLKLQKKRQKLNDCEQQQQQQQQPTQEDYAAAATVVSPEPFVTARALPTASRNDDAIDDNWSWREVELLEKLMEQPYKNSTPPRWSKIAASFPRRDALECKTKWERLLNVTDPLTVKKKDAPCIAVAEKKPDRIVQREKQAPDDVCRKKRARMAKHVVLPTTPTRVPSQHGLLGGDNNDDSLVVNRTYQLRKWTKYEDSILIAKYKVMGGQWTQIAKCFPGRSRHSISCRWARLLERGEIEEGPMELNDMAAHSMDPFDSSAFTAVTQPSASANADVPQGQEEENSEDIESSADEMDGDTDDTDEEEMDQDCWYTSGDLPAPAKLSTRRRRRSSAETNPWTPAEDQMLRKMHARYGAKWKQISEHLPGRSGCDCRYRFVNHLNEHLRKKEEWTREEDEVLIAEHERWGNRWAKIASSLTGRSPLSVRHRWYSVSFQSHLQQLRNKEPTARDRIARTVVKSKTRSSRP